MQKKNILVKLISILFIIGITWLFFFLSEKVQKNVNDSISSYIPLETEWLLEINTKDLIDKGVQSVLFSNKPDSELNNLINEIIITQQNQGVSVEKIGINLTTKIYVFKKNNQIVALFELNNPKKFKENIPNLLPPYFHSFNNKTVGIISYSKDNNGQKLAEEILSNNNPHFESTNYSLSLRINEQNSKVNINSSILDSSILINGYFNLNHQELSPSLSLKPNGFHFSSRFVPEQISDSICEIFKIKNNRLLGFSMNHLSSEMVTGSRAIIKLNSSFLFHFKHPIDIEEQFLELSESNNSLSVDSSAFSIDGSKYYFRQISDKSFYLGEKEFILTDSLLKEQNDIFFVKGKPSRLTKLEGKGLIRRFINIIPLFHASEILTNSIDEVLIESSANLSGNNVLVGGIKFKKGKKSMNELMRFVLLLNE